MKYLILFFLLLFNFSLAQIFPLSNSQDVDQDGIVDISIVFYPPQPPPNTGFIGYKIFAKSGFS